MKIIGIVCGATLVSIFLAYGGFKLYRWFNWSFGYESLVRSTIEQMVKPECLKKEK